MNRKLTIVIHRAPEEVFRYIATNYFENMPKWSLAKEDLHKTSDEPMRVGSTAKLITECANCANETVLLVMDYQPNTSMVIEETTQYVDLVPQRNPDTKTMKVIRSFYFEPVPGGTKIIYNVTSTVAAKGLLNLLMPLYIFWTNIKRKQISYTMADLIDGPVLGRKIKMVISRLLTSRLTVIGLLVLLLAMYFASQTIRLSSSWGQLLNTTATALLVIAIIGTGLMGAFLRSLEAQ